jgi:hypothetical protein
MKKGKTTNRQRFDIMLKVAAYQAECIAKHGGPTIVRLKELTSMMNTLHNELYPEQKLSDKNGFLSNMFSILKKAGKARDHVFLREYCYAYVDPKKRFGESSGVELGPLVKKYQDNSADLYTSFALRAEDYFVTVMPKFFEDTSDDDLQELVTEKRTAAAIEICETSKEEVLARIAENAAKAVKRRKLAAQNKEKGTATTGPKKAKSAKAAHTQTELKLPESSDTSFQFAHIASISEMRKLPKYAVAVECISDIDNTSDAKVVLKTVLGVSNDDANILVANRELASLPEDAFQEKLKTLTAQSVPMVEHLALLGRVRQLEEKINAVSAS